MLGQVSFVIEGQVSFNIECQVRLGFLTLFLKLQRRGGCVDRKCKHEMLVGGFRIQQYGVQRVGVAGTQKTIVFRVSTGCDGQHTCDTMERSMQPEPDTQTQPLTCLRQSSGVSGTLFRERGSFLVGSGGIEYPPGIESPPPKKFSKTVCIQKAF